MGARGRAHGRAKRLVQRHAIVGQIKDGHGADYLEHCGERVVPSQLAGHGRRQEKRIPLVGDGYLGRERHFEYGRRYPVPVVTCYRKHLKPDVI